MIESERAILWFLSGPLTAEMGEPPLKGGPETGLFTPKASTNVR